jgi:hypothetical protein
MLVSGNTNVYHYQANDYDDKAHYLHEELTALRIRMQITIATTPNTQNPAATQNPSFTWRAASLFATTVVNIVEHKNSSD